MLPKKRTYTVSLDEKEIVFVNNYGKKIIEARSKINLTRKEFAKKINERESLIKRIEREEMRPDETLTKKIENFLKIKLTEIYEKKKFGKKPTKGNLTIGDIVELR